MNRFFIICLLLLFGCAAFSQAKQKSADELKKEMAEIRRNTNWSNESEANKSQAKIEELSKQLMIIRKMEQQQQAGATVDSAKLNEEAEYKMGLWKQMMAAVDQGESGDILLAKPLREKIVEAYKNDESPKVKNPEYFEEQTFLCIDMSVPTIQRIIDQMENFKSIKALMITCSKEPVSVDLEDLLARAKNYPLEQLHIINFKQYVNDIPDEIGQFQGLKVLTLLNNNIDQLPASIVQLGDLKKLYVDINPISTLMPSISSLNMLDTLGIAKTQISESEIGQIKALLPNCKILDK
jgi:hypothetical protein